MSVSILILTLNEETNIGACLDSVAWSDDIVVFDSHSSDRTVAIAEARGARIERRVFDDWSSHQNWAVTHIRFKYPWVLYIDADERCSEELAREIQARATADSEYSAFRIRRKDYFRGTWLKHAQLYPTWLVRLFRPERIRYERLVNPVAVVEGETGALEGHIDHYPFSHGVGHWVARHNRYSDMEAREWLKSRRESRWSLGDLVSPDPNSRRKALKEIFFRIPGRPLVKFLYYYFARRGFLDGGAGFTYAMLQAIYEYLIVLKVDEIKRNTSP